MFEKIKYLISWKSNISAVYYHKYMKIKINSNDDLPLGKTLTMHNIVICIKFAFNNNYNYYYFQVVLQKCLNKLAEKI